MRRGIVVPELISGASCRRVLRRAILAIVLILAVGASLSTSTAALATPLGPWLPNPPADISVPSSSSTTPQVAVGPDGATTITWTRSNGLNDIVQVATRAAGSSAFSGPIDLSSTGGNADSPQIAIATDGTTTITWRRANGLNWAVQAATRAAGATSFSTAIDVSASGENVTNPQIAIGHDGTTTIAWNRNNGSDDIVRAATRAAGATTFGTAIDVSATRLNDDSPQVAVGPDGATTITWIQYLGLSGGVTVQAATRTAGAPSFTTPIDVCASSEFYLVTPQIAVGADGTTTITWIGMTSSNQTIVQTATRAAGSITFSDPTTLSDNQTDATNPQVAVGPDGATTITWTLMPGWIPTMPIIVQAATRAAGSSTFSVPLDLSSTGGNADSPQIAIAADGTTTITWSFGDGSHDIVQAATRAADASVFSAPVNLSAPGADSTAPQVAAGPDGSTTITWNRGDNGGNNIVQAVTASPSPSVLTVTKDENGTVAPPAAPRGIRWTMGNHSTNQLITGSFTAAPDTTYTITATSNATRRFQTRTTRTASGTCKVKTNKTTKKRTATCTIRLKKAGTWLVKITPTQNGSAGTPATKTIKIQTPRPAATTHPNEPVTG